MAAFIIIVEIALFMLLIGFIWYRAEAFDGMEKVVICVAGILICWLITNVIFSISSNGIEYNNKNVEQEVGKVLVLIFTPINGIVVMPYATKIISQVRFEEIDKKEAIKQFGILALVLIAVFFIEIKYLNGIQNGILEIANKT